MYGVPEISALIKVFRTNSQTLRPKTLSARDKSPPMGSSCKNSSENVFKRSVYTKMDFFRKSTV
jgi:hypothetical protein